MPNHDELIEATENAINAVYGDTSVSQEETLQDLRTLGETIEDLCAAIQLDLGKDSE